MSIGDSEHRYIMRWCRKEHRWAKSMNQIEQHLGQSLPMPEESTSACEKGEIHTVSQTVCVKQFRSGKTNISLVQPQNLFGIKPAGNRYRPMNVNDSLQPASRSGAIKPESRLIRRDIDRNKLRPKAADPVLPAEVTGTIPANDDDLSEKRTALTDVLNKMSQRSADNQHLGAAMIQQ